MKFCIHVRLFAQLREHAGTDSLHYDIPVDGIVLSELLAKLHKVPELGPSLAGVRVMTAVNQTMSSGGHWVMPGDEVALFPPVTGG